MGIRAVLKRCSLAAGVALLLGVLGGCAATAPAQCARARLAYVGTDGGQLQALRLDACSGSLTSLGTVATLAKPRWSTASAKAPILYVADDVAGKDGTVTAFAVDRDSGALTKIDEVDAGGVGTTDLWLDAESSTLLAAHFFSGSVTTLPIGADGSVGAAASTIKETGSGPNKRQTKAHAHGVVIDPSGHHALVADLGADRVFVYGFDRASRRLEPDDAGDPHAFAVAPGSGPHHAVFSQDGRFVYLLDELSADVQVLRWDAGGGQLSRVQSLSIGSAGYQGPKSGAEIAVSRDGRTVYVGDRGENALVAYRVDADTGELSLLQRVPSGGEKPWGFAIDPSGRWMLVANSARASLFEIDQASGKLADTGRSVACATPLSISFMP